MSILPFVASSTSRFIKADEMREVVSLALVSKKNFIFFGPGGHGKSELMDAIMAAIDGAVTMTQTCTISTQPEDLFGGVNLKAINCPDNPRVEYNPENSGLNSDFWGLEEGFDATPAAAAALKDVLTSKALRNGAQYYESKLNLVYINTNKEPGDIAALGDWASALVERFPLQLRVAWGSYAASDYTQLFATENGVGATITFAEIIELQKKCKEVTVPTAVKKILAELLAKAGEKGEKISPRTAMLALDLVRAAATISGRGQAEKGDIIAIKYLPGCEELAASIESEIDAAHKRSVAEDEITRISNELGNLKGQMGETPLKIMQASKRMGALVDQLSQLSVPDGLTEQRDKLTETINTAILEADKAAKDAVRI